MSLADSAGTPWEGRHFEPNRSSDDDGSAAPALLAVFESFANGDADEASVVDEIRRSRFLIPLLAHLGESEISPDGHLIDKTQELSIVTVTAPDGRRVLPIFSSVSTMGEWNPIARPVPADAQRIAIAAATEQTDLVIVDPTSSTEFVVRRPALWAIAQELDWVPSYRDPAVAREFAASIDSETAVTQISLEPGDPTARLRGPELIVRLALLPGLDRIQLDALLARVQERWSRSEIIAERVDSLTVALTTST